MNNFVKGLRTLALTSLMVAALPMAASALSVGVSDSIDTSIVSGHLCRQSDSYSVKQGVEWSSMDSSKVGHSNEQSQTSSSVVDPAQSTSSVQGSFDIAEHSSAASVGSYASVSHSSESLTGGSEADTSIVHTVSAFSNP